MDNKTKVIIILSAVLAIIIGLSIFVFIKSVNTPKPDPIIIYPEQTIIDSLNTEIANKEKEIQKLKTEIANRKVIIVREIEKIKELPLDTNITMMRSNLEKLGRLTELGDTLPKRVILNESKDTAVMISPNNVKDVNIIASELTNSKAIDSLLERQVSISSLIIARKDSIITEQSIMFQRQDYLNKINTESLQKSLEQERREKTKMAIILGGTTAVSLTVTGFLIAKLTNK